MNLWSLTNKASELTGLLYPAIIKLTSITSYHTLWWIKGSEHNPHITNHFPEIICANAATALRLSPFTFSVLGDIPAFLKFRKRFSHTQKTLSFSSISSLETTYSTSESHPNGTRTRIWSVKGSYPRPVRRWGVISQHFSFQGVLNPNLFTTVRNKSKQPYP